MKLVPSWWTTNKQLRVDIQKIGDELVAQRVELLAAKQSNRILRSDLDRKRDENTNLVRKVLGLEAELRAATIKPAKVPSHIEGMRSAKEVLGGTAPVPRGPAVRTQRSVITQGGFSKPRPDDPVVTRQQDSGSSDFLTGAVVGMVVNEIFSSNSSSDSSSSSSSDNGISSGGGGDFGGGGASGSWD